jgi:hypothetical protein
MIDEEPKSDPEEGTESADKYYHGRIAKLFRGSQMGVVRSGNGREIRFEFLHLTMVGPLRRFEDLREGMAVGFDVGWTSKGLRVTVMRAGGDADAGPGRGGDDEPRAEG